MWLLKSEKSSWQNLHLKFWSWFVQLYHVENSRLKGQLCSSRWCVPLWATSSGSTVFGNPNIFIFRASGVKFSIINCKQDKRLTDLEPCSVREMHPEILLCQSKSFKLFFSRYFSFYIIIMFVLYNLVQSEVPDIIVLNFQTVFILQFLQILTTV